MDRSLEQFDPKRDPSSGEPADGARPDERTALPIAETFTSIQGEGVLTGVPSHFIRVSGCNLRCRWCDTPYASWSPEGERRTIEALVDEMLASGVRHAVLTGGEPMIFPAIETLAAHLHEHGIHITIETAGTVSRAIACDLMSISPKLANSTPHEDQRDPSGVWARRHEQRRINLDALADLLRGPWQYQLKFVIANPGDVPEIESLLAELSARAGRIPADRVLMMPEGTTVPAPGSTRWLADLCVRRGWRYCQRLHIELFGNTRGT